MRKTLRKLYRNQPAYFDSKLDKDPGFGAEVDQWVLALDDLQGTLSVEQKSQLDRLLEHCRSMEQITAEHAFAEGFLFCTRLAKL